MPNIKSADKFYDYITRNDILGNLAAQTKLALVAKVNNADNIDLRLLFKKDSGKPEIAKYNFGIEYDDVHANLDVLLNIMTLLPKIAQQASGFIYKICCEARETSFIKTFLEKQGPIDTRRPVDFKAQDHCRWQLNSAAINSKLQDGQNSILFTRNTIAAGKNWKSKALKFENISKLNLNYDLETITGTDDLTTTHDSTKFSKQERTKLLVLMIRKLYEARQLRVVVQI